jgi:4'-phosphopantetheinyl transferase
VLQVDPDWPQSTDRIALDHGAVHIWRSSLAPDAGDNRFALLSTDEQRRAQRFLSPRARQQFIAARAALRSILSRYVKCAPAQIRFLVGPLGKPALTDPGHPPLHFNLSHSGELALVAVTHAGEIGVDVEQVRERSTADRLAERFFHPNEVAELRRLPIEQRTIGFFNAWTRKEAWLKATGKGISYGIDRVEVTLVPGHTPRVLSVDGNTAAAGAWSLEAVHPGAGYIGAAALRGSWGRIVFFTL